MDGERLLAVFSSLVEPLGRSLPASSEVVLHDLSLLPDSIVAVYGDVTGRRAGDPATNLLLEKSTTGFAENSTIGYESHLPDGRRLRSSTMIIRDVAGNPVAALCINTDISAWEAIDTIVNSMLRDRPTAGHARSVGPVPVPSKSAAAESSGANSGPNSGVGEVFVRDVDELASYLITTAIADQGVPVEFMKKEHKVKVVHQLRDRGLFTIRNAVDLCATQLDVTRFTIYNYLNAGPEDPKAVKR